MHDYITEERFSIVISNVHADHTVTSHGVCVCPSLDALQVCGLNAARQRASGHGSEANTGGNHEKGTALTIAAFSPSFHHTGPLGSLLSAYTKPRAELLTGGGRAAPGRLLVCRRWYVIGRMRRMIFSSVSRFTSSPATVVLNNNLLSLWGGQLCA